MQKIHLAFGLAMAFAFLSGCEWPWTDTSKATTPWIEAFKKNEELENRVFSKLIFSYSRNFNKSVTQKFVVTDQLGREWLFKLGKGATDGALAQYRMMKLTGIDTPEIHRASLNVNGETEEGTLQRFVKNSVHLERTEFNADHPDIVNMMAKNNVLSWLTGGHHVHFKQFLLSPAEGGKPDKIFRIDNTIEWYLVGQDRLTYDYTTPFLFHMGGLGYTTFWRRYFQKRVNPDLQGILDWARLIEKLPDDFYGDFYSEGVKNDLLYFTNVILESPGRRKRPGYVPWGKRAFPDFYRPEERPKFMERIMKRKRSLGADVEEYFTGLTEIRGEKIKFKSDTDFVATAAVLIDRLKKSDEELTAILQKIESLPPRTQPVIEAPLSIKGYNIARKLYGYVVAEPAKLKDEREWDETIRLLEELRKNVPYRMEKEAISTLLGYVKEDHQAYKENRVNWKSFYARFFNMQNEVQKSDLAPNEVPKDDDEVDF